MKIKELIINTKNFEKQLTFYNENLEFELIHKTKTSASFQIGESILTFIEKNNATPYHFAFNIPFNKVNKALNWLKARVTIIPFENQEIINFVSWKAKAIYFYDTDYNIVEFIGRKAIYYKSEPEFNSKNVINISEVGIGTNNINEIYSQLNAIKSINIFDGNFEKFCAFGNDEGLFIAVDMSKKEWFPTRDQIYPSDFIIKGDYNLEYTDQKLKKLI